MALEIKLNLIKGKDYVDFKNVGFEFIKINYQINPRPSVLGIDS